MMTANEIQTLPSPYIEDVIEHIRNAQTIVFLTGAGISAESGVPTFRDAQTGLWATYRPEELATPEAFYRNPELVWSWYEWRRNLIAQASPNPAHRTIAWVEKLFKNVWVVTQNVDNLHREAGSTRILELHGNIFHTICSACRYDMNKLRYEKGKGIPRCPQCGGLSRPDVVWFGEPLPSDVLSKAWALSETCDMMFVVGTSAVVQPAASLPFVALQNDGYVVEINPNHTILSSAAHLTFRMKAVPFFEHLRTQLKNIIAPNNSS